ncbi:MAG: hypothetical protein M0D57_08260 [Sphingobacteriales bacterium JAD_PAG50586_3]|nr:MAG: hypothetical protein M0D57_08260 [Sphingobacteriales bacterium JAD_PAG50586_3]
MRNSKFVKMPSIMFLHGCVAIGVDKTTGKSGPVGYETKDGNAYEPTQLLYPVEHKDYNNDAYIKGEWEKLQAGLDAAERVTIFGYSAPVTDVEAISLLQNAWGTVEERDMEQFEMIDVREEQTVKSSWNTFIHTHHYDYRTSFLIVL